MALALREIKWPRKPAVAMGLLVGVPLLIAWNYPGVLAPFLLSAVLAFLLNPVILALDHVLKKIPRRLARAGGIRVGATRPVAVTIFFVWALSVVALFGFPLVVGLASNLYALADEVSSISGTAYQKRVEVLIEEARLRLEDVPWLRDELESIASDSRRVGAIASGLNWLVRFTATQLQRLASVVVSLFATGASLAVVPLLVFYMLADWDRLTRAIRSAVPPDYQGWYSDFTERLDVTFGGYIRAQLLICLVFGSAVTLGLYLLGIPYALLLGPIAGAADFVPYLGVIVGLIPTVIIVFLYWGLTSEAILHLIPVVILFSVLQFVDGFVLQPRIWSGNVGLHPLAILFALALGQALGGIYGVLLAVPAASLLKVLSVDLKRFLYEAEATEAPETSS